MDFITFFLWLCVFCGMGAGAYLFYQVVLRAEQRRYEPPQ